MSKNTKAEKKNLKNELLDEISELNASLETTSNLIRKSIEEDTVIPTRMLGKSMNIVSNIVMEGRTITNEASDGLDDDDFTEVAANAACMIDFAVDLGEFIEDELDSRMAETDGLLDELLEEMDEELHDGDAEDEDFPEDFEEVDIDDPDFAEAIRSIQDALCAKGYMSEDQHLESLSFEIADDYGCPCEDIGGWSDEEKDEYERKLGKNMDKKAAELIDRLYNLGMLKEGETIEFCAAAHYKTPISGNILVQDSKIEAFSHIDHVHESDKNCPLNAIVNDIAAIMKELDMVSQDSDLAVIIVKDDEENEGRDKPDTQAVFEMVEGILRDSGLLKDHYKLAISITSDD